MALRAAHYAMALVGLAQGPFTSGGRPVVGAVATAACVPSRYGARGPRRGAMALRREVTDAEPSLAEGAHSCSGSHVMAWLMPRRVGCNGAGALPVAPAMAVRREAWWTDGAPTGPAAMLPSSQTEVTEARRCNGAAGARG